MQFQGVFFGQTDLKDTISIDEKTIDEIVKYSARDSIHHDFKNKKAYLYGDAKVDMGTITLQAGVIILDFILNEVEAKFILDKDQQMVEFPILTEGSEKIECHRMRMNLKTEKVYIEELGIQQDELYFKMGVAKRYADDQIHLKKGRLSTCDLEEPHYHFQLSKGVMIPDKRIVAGPMNLWISGIPTPLGLPFAFIPQQKDRTHGILFPEFIPSSQYGFGVQNLGYYIPINDNFQTSIYANLYSRGSWGLRNDLEYSKKYGFSGRISAGYQQFNDGFPNYKHNKKITLSWSHTKQNRSNPYWNFSSNVNFISDNTTKNNLDPINPEYFSNTFNSDINLNRLFPGKPLTIGSKISMRQNSSAKNISLVSPILNVNMTRVFPFKNLIKSSKKEWQKSIQRIGLTYNMETQNKSTFGDSLLSDFNYSAIGQSFLNGISQGIGLQTTLALFKNTIKISPNVSYGNKVNFQQISKSYNGILNATHIDTFNKAAMAHEFNFNVSATSVVYSYYRFVGKNKPILRHIMTPSIGYRFVPKLNPLISAPVGTNQSMIMYSPFEKSIYTVGNTQDASYLNFGLNNSFEFKIKSDKDTLTGYKKIRIVDQLSINGNYDFKKDTMKMSNITMNLRISPFKWMNFVSTGTFSPYSWDSLGKSVATYAIQNSQGLGRILNVGINTTFTLSSAKSKAIIEEKKNEINTNWNSDFNYFILHPEQAIYFEIPWKLNISHVYSLAANTDIKPTNPNPWISVQSLALNGDITFTKRWNFSSNVNFDLENLKLSNMNVALNRNMHCWALSFYWTPIGGNKSFLLSIRNTSSLFKDAKIELRKPPSFF